MQEENTHEPKKMTFRQNVILTIEVLGGFAGIGVALWAINLWTTGGK